MPVYVDNMKAPFGNMVMCHMWADTDAELLAMADRIGVQRKWIQGHPTLSFGRHRKASWVHFDIAQSKRALAVKNGAIETDRYGPVEHLAKINIASGDPALVAYGRRKLEQIAGARAIGARSIDG
ncbi:MAG: DUF4031 domain-containing protein [Pseudomonadota bacterium]